MQSVRAAYSLCSEFQAPPLKYFCQLTSGLGLSVHAQRQVKLTKETM